METVNLKDCDKALVYGTNKKPLSHARVLDTGSSVYLFLDNCNLRQAHIKVLVDFYVPTRGIVRCFCDLHIRENQQIGSPSERWAAECRILELAGVIQRQKDLRVPINMPIFFSSGTDILRRGVIKNISAGGICLVTKQALTNGSRFSYDCMLNGVSCNVKAQVIYGRVLSEGYSYGCSFYDLSAQTERIIRSWCHEHQERRAV